MVAVTEWWNHPIRGLAHSAQPSNWDPETVLHAPDWRSRTGHTDGWHWATDTATVCGVREDDEYDDDSPMARKVVEYLTADLVAPIYAVEPRDGFMLGGTGRLRDWGLWDLDRVADAIAWIVGDDGDRFLLAIDPGPALRMVAPSGRVALVMGMREPDPDSWYPSIDLPVHAVDSAEAAS